MGALTPDRADSVRPTLSVYALRRARMVFLRHFVSDAEHPVLVAERSLVEMARSKLLEQLLAAHGDSLLSHRAGVEMIIREEMRKKMAGLASGIDLAALLEQVNLETMDSLFFARGA